MKKFISDVVGTLVLMGVLSLLILAVDRLMWWMR